MTNQSQVSNLSKIKAKLRTEGAVTGNFGRSKVRAGSTLNDLGSTSKESISIPSVLSYINRMWAVYDTAPSPALQRFAINELHRLGVFKERRLVRQKPEPYRPKGT